MNTKYIALGAIVMLLLASCTPKEELTNSETNIAQEVNTESEIPAASSSEGPTSYREYNGEDLSSVGVQTVLFFHQKSCGTCVKTDKDIMSQSELPDDLKIIKVDFDTETELNARYGVTTKHTFVLIDENGNMLAKEIGLARTEDIAAFAEAGSNVEAPTEVQEEEQAIKETVVEETPVLEEAGVVPVLAVASKGAYMDYNGTVPGDTVLFFHAKWCPSCVAADKGFSTESELAIDTDIIKIDYDNSNELKAKYGVTSQHTFVLIDADGNLVKKMAGGTKSSDLAVLFN